MFCEVAEHEMPTAARERRLAVRGCDHSLRVELLVESFVERLQRPEPGEPLAVARRLRGPP